MSEIDFNNLEFEDALAQLETIVRELEAGRIKLDDAVEAYEKAMALKKFCEDKLKNAELKIEKINVVSFCYSINGSRFLAKLWTGMNVDSSVLFSSWMPKVDWTRSWTVEEILKDYGYTEDEIKEVMEDLKNFKGMDD